MFSHKKFLIGLFLITASVICLVLCNCSPFYFTDRTAGNDYLQNKYHQSFTFSKNSQNGHIWFPDPDEHPVMYFLDADNNEFIVRYDKQKNKFQDNYQAYQFASEFSEKFAKILGPNYKVIVNCNDIELNRDNVADSLEDYLNKAANRIIKLNIYTTDRSVDNAFITNIILNNFNHSPYFITVYNVKDLDSISTKWYDVNDNNKHKDISKISSWKIEYGKISKES